MHVLEYVKSIKITTTGVVLCELQCNTQSVSAASCGISHTFAVEIVVCDFNPKHIFICLHQLSSSWSRLLKYLNTIRAFLCQQLMNDNFLILIPITSESRHRWSANVSYMYLTHTSYLLFHISFICLWQTS